MKWRWLIWLFLLLSNVSARTASGTELEAKRYLHACINAVAFAVIESGMTKAFDGQPCDNSAFDIARFFDGKSNTSAVAKSRIKFGTAGVADFEVDVRDTDGKNWTGSLGNSPKIPPRKSPLTPEQLTQSQAAAYQVAAQNVARSCVMAIEQYKVDNFERPEPEWDGKGCIEVGLVAASNGEVIKKSLITFRPESQEGYQVTVWPKLGGETVMLPEKLTKKLLEPTPTPSLPVVKFLVTWFFGPLISLALWFVLAFKLPSHPIVGGLGMTIAVLAFLASVTFVPSSFNTQLEWGFLLGAIPLAILIGGLFIALPRLAYWYGHEDWWVSLGTGILSAPMLIVALISTPIYSALSGNLWKSVFYVLSLLIALTCYALWQRSHLIRPLP